MSKLSETFLKTLDDMASKEDTGQLFKKLTDFVKQAKARLEEMLAAFKDEIRAALDEQDTKLTELEGRLTTRQDSDKETMYSESRTLQRYVDQNLEDVRRAIPTLPDLTPYDRRFEDVEKRIPKLPEELSAEGIRNKLETLQGEERLHVSAIDGLEDLVKRVDTLSKAPAPIVAGVAGRDIFKDIDLSSQLNGVTKTFALPATWNVISVHLSSFPHALRKNIDFTYTNTSITFTSAIDAAAALAAGQTCVLTVVTA